MCAIQVALCLLTGSLEMSVFQTLSAGNIWQFGAPGTGGPFGDVVRGTVGAEVVLSATEPLAKINGRQAMAATCPTRSAGAIDEPGPYPKYRPPGRALSASCECGPRALRSARRRTARGRIR